ncbi:hypothetical protein P5495_022005 [Bacillus velezensis]|uniref:hypothetical protein n=1 Tax=Bacillus amyloliquefaciens group TaxID=1938374 RepID=UPI001CD20866|nr:hypothetical protein [Bacillus amyloliquefaciens]MDH3075833.1 hypothetical protein [Bacillus velezensis]MDH3104099.1 hypothetical protein [Bacillus velezensis]MDH3138997.1 hypothetical protein [Bacillus velezensis]
MKDIREILLERLVLLERSSLSLNEVEFASIVNAEPVVHYAKKTVPVWTREIHHMLYREYIWGAGMFMRVMREELGKLGLDVEDWNIEWQNAFSLMKLHQIEFRDFLHEDFKGTCQWTHEFALYLNTRLNEYEKHGELDNVSSIEKNYLEGIMGDKAVYERFFYDKEYLDALCGKNAVCKAWKEVWKIRKNLA